jgi:hypothetical protein
MELRSLRVFLASNIESNAVMSKLHSRKSPQDTITELVARLSKIINEGNTDTLVLGQRIIALEMAIDDALRCLENNDKNGAMGCLRAAKVDPDMASFTQAVARARAMVKAPSGCTGHVP